MLIFFTVETLLDYAIFFIESPQQQKHMFPTHLVETNVKNTLIITGTHRAMSLDKFKYMKKLISSYPNACQVSRLGLYLCFHFFSSIICAVISMNIIPPIKISNRLKGNLSSALKWDVNSFIKNQAVKMGKGCLWEKKIFYDKDN